MQSNRERYGSLTVLKEARLSREGFTGVLIDSLTGEYRVWWQGKRVGGLYLTLRAAKLALVKQFACTIQVVE